ncbi:MAG: YceI family protein [Bacteroidetes bacterium]|nr:YceI family protein [Bacteroidota bacterium]
MKTFLFSLLMLCHAWSGKPVVNYEPGGVSVLAVNTSSSSVGWSAQKPTGTHTGTVKISSGNLTMHCGQLYSGTVILDMATLTVDDLTQPDKQKLEDNLRSDYFFDTGKFPEARLDIISVNHNSEKTWHFITVAGSLTLRGITRRITFTADVSKSAVNEFAAEANIVINRRDWNIATSNVKYDTFIYREIHLHVSLQAGKPDTQLTSL